MKFQSTGLLLKNVSGSGHLAQTPRIGIISVIPRILSLLLMICLTLNCFSSVLADDSNTYTVSSVEDFVKAFNETTGDVSIILTSDIVFENYYDLSQQNGDRVITISGAKEDGAKPVISGNTPAYYSSIVLHNIKTGSLALYGSTADLYDVEVTGTIAPYKEKTSAVNIYSGSIAKIANPNNVAVNFMPQGNISVETIEISGRATKATVNIIPQDNYTISEISYNNAIQEIPTETFTWQGKTAKVTVSSLSITVSESSSGSGDSTLTDASFTAPADDYFTTAGISVTPSTEDLSFTVACDNACVVAKVDGDTYTRMTGTAVTGGYSFTATSASDQFVVVVKGDLNFDGDTDGTDASQIDRYAAGLRNLTALQALVCDINGDGDTDGTDASQIKRFGAGLRSFAWDV